MVVVSVETANCCARNNKRLTYSIGHCASQNIIVNYRLMSRIMLNVNDMDAPFFADTQADGRTASEASQHERIQNIIIIVIIR